MLLGVYNPLGVLIFCSQRRIYQRPVFVGIYNIVYVIYDLALIYDLLSVAYDQAVVYDLLSAFKTLLMTTIYYELQHLFPAN